MRQVPHPGEECQRQRGGMTSHTFVPDPIRAAALHPRRATLHTGAAQIVTALDLPTLLAPARRVEQIGRAVSGLMVWRDLDFNIVAPAAPPNASPPHSALSSSTRR